MRWMKEKVEEQEKEKEPPVRARQQVASRESPATRRCACGEHVTGWLPWETAARYLCCTVRDAHFVSPLGFSCARRSSSFPLAVRTLPSYTDY